MTICSSAPGGRTRSASSKAARASDCHSHWHRATGSLRSIGNMIWSGRMLRLGPPPQFQRSVSRHRSPSWPYSSSSACTAFAACEERRVARSAAFRAWAAHFAPPTWSHTLPWLFSTRPWSASRECFRRRQGSCGPLRSRGCTSAPWLQQNTRVGRLLPLLPTRHGIERQLSDSRRWAVRPACVSWLGDGGAPPRRLIGGGEPRPGVALSCGRLPRRWATAHLPVRALPTTRVPPPRKRSLRESPRVSARQSCGQDDTSSQHSVSFAQVPSLLRCRHHDGANRTEEGMARGILTQRVYNPQVLAG